MNLKKSVKEVQAKRRRYNFDENDKTKLNVLLKEALTNNLINSDDAHQLAQSVENGYISLSEAYKYVEQVLQIAQ